MWSYTYSIAPINFNISGDLQARSYDRNYIDSAILYRPEARMMAAATVNCSQKPWQHLLHNYIQQLHVAVNAAGI